MDAGGDEAGRSDGQAVGRSGGRAVGNIVHQPYFPTPPLPLAIVTIVEVCFMVSVYFVSRLRLVSSFGFSSVGFGIFQPLTLNPQPAT